MMLLYPVGVSFGAQPAGALKVEVALKFTLVSIAGHSKISGARDFDRPFQKVILGEEVESDGRESYLRAIVPQKDDKVIAHLSGHQGSGNLLSLVQSNALILIPSGVKSLPAGSEIDAWVFEN